MAFFLYFQYIKFIPIPGTGTVLVFPSSKANLKVKVSDPFQEENYLVSRWRKVNPSK